MGQHGPERPGEVGGPVGSPSYQRYSLPLARHPCIDRDVERAAQLRHWVARKRTGTAECPALLVVLSAAMQARLLDAAGQLDQPLDARDSLLVGNRERLPRQLGVEVAKRARH